MPPRQIGRRRRGIVAVALAQVLAMPALAAAPQQATAAPQQPAPAWPPGTTELPADPAMHFARLDNGLRFAFLPHDKPAKRVSLRLIVQAGSIDEHDDELGMAHFVEHMAFNGTRRFPGNTVDDWFRSRGMRIGRHANANTTEIATIYRIDLPDNGDATVAEGFAVLREFTDGLLFDAAEVEAEKGVIDAEQRERPLLEIAEQARAGRLGAGGRLATREILGTPASRALFTPAALRAFHTRWYRPDNMIVLVVGELAATAAEAACQTAFGSVAMPATPLPARAAPGRPTLADTTFAIDDPNRADCEILVCCPIVGEPEPTSLARIRSAVRRTTTCEMLRWILVDNLVGADHAAMAVSVRPMRADDLDQSLDGIAIVLRCPPRETARALAECADVMADVASELTTELFERVRTVQLEALAQDLAHQRGAATAAKANDLVGKLISGIVPVADELAVAQLGEASRNLSAEQCQREFREAWRDEALSITTLGPPGHGVDAKAIWSRATISARRLQADAPANLADPAPKPTWPFSAATPEAPTPLRHDHDEALGVDDVRFANGIRVLMKPCQATPGEIHIHVVVGRGTLGLDDAERHAAQGLVLMLPHIGLGTLDDAAVRDLTGARRARVGAACFPGSFFLRGRTDQDTLAFQLEWLCALCATPGDDWAALTPTLRAFALRDVPAAQSSSGQMLRFLGAVTGQAVHVDRDQLLAVDAAAMRSLVKHCWVGAPITVVVVGDFAAAMTLDTVARTFGRLPKRPAADEHTTADSVATVEKGVHHEVELGAAEPSGLIAVVASLSADEGAGTVLPVRVLTRVLTDRLTRKVREQMGATYTAQALAADLGGKSRCSMLWIQARTAPGQEAAALAATLAQIELLRDGGITAAELEAARQPLRNELRERSATSGYWLFELSQAHGRPTALGEMAQVGAKLDAVTQDDVREAARRCLAAARLSTLVVAAKPAK